MRDLILTGFMGTGKSTIGRILAGRFGLLFVDTDEEVERRAGRPIGEIFEAQGEDEFRRLESAVLADLASDEGRVIATGGGLLMSERNRALLEPDQMVICLTCQETELEARLAGDSTRPLLANGIRTLLESRREAYARFPQVDTTGRPPEHVAEEIALQVRAALAGELTFVDQRRTMLRFERGSASRAGSLLSGTNAPSRAILITDETLQSLGVHEPVVASLAATPKGYPVQTDVVVLPAGEQSKNLETLQRLYSECMERALDRRSMVIGLGGGVVCDLAGMLAATYLRGLRLLLIPTTLMAQVDAAIGGKTGVDFRDVKNLIGSFYPAEVILIDPDLLRTLPPSALADGLAEVVKIAAVRSRALLEMTETLHSARDVLCRPAIIRRAALEKMRVVERDPYERGERAMLNFGHTVGHAAEAASGYRLSHGRAVSIGMVAETWLAEERGWCSPGMLSRLTGLLERFGLPTRAAELSIDVMMRYLFYDKKRSNGQARFAVPTGPGEGAVFPVSRSDVEAALGAAGGAR